MSTVTVSDKGQVVIPASIRHRLGIEPGTKLDFELEGDTIRVRALAGRRADSAGGRLWNVEVRSTGRKAPHRLRRRHRHARHRR
jgi:AbrB family looped-hinge helix DNA binding protein